MWGWKRVDPSFLHWTLCQSSARMMAASLLGKMLSQSYSWRDGGGPQPAPQNLSSPTLPHASGSVTVPSQSSHPHPQVHTEFIPPTPSLRVRGDRTGAVSPCPGYSPTCCAFLSGVCGSHEMTSSALTFSFSSQETRPSSWLATRRGESSAGQQKGRRKQVRRPRHCSWVSRGLQQQAAGVEVMCSRSPIPRASFWGLSSPQFSRNPRCLHCVPRTSLWST